MSEFKKEEKKERKGGFWPFLSNLLGGGSSAMGGASGGTAGMGAAGSGLGGLFATKAGVMGLVLGAATIAAGVGVVYNFVGPSSKPVYSPQLFQDTYYEEQANNAGLERAKQKEDASASASTLDLFREQAKKDGLGLSAEDGAAAEENKDASAESAAADGAADANAPAPAASANPAADAPAGAKLQGAFGFGSKGGGGGSSSNIPRMTGGGGMFGGINGQFSPVYKAPAGKAQGKVGAMRGSLASAVKGSSKYSVPVSKSKGALGQAKFAGRQGIKSAQGGDLTASRTGATEAFSGETAGAGDVGAPAGGTGITGAGLSSASQLKSSDPSLNSNEYTPPKVGKPEDVTPWTKYTDMAMYALLAAAVLVFIANELVKKAKLMIVGAPATAAMFMYAKIVAGMAMIAAGVAIYAGLMLMKGEPDGNPPWTGQKWTGGLYGIMGGMLIYQAYKAFVGAAPNSAAETVKTAVDAAQAAPKPVEMTAAEKTAEMMGVNSGWDQ